MDTKHVINCPACGSKMIKVEFPSTDFHIDICADGCGGIFFDDKELAKIMSSREIVDGIINYLNNTSFKMPCKDDLRVCSVCNNPMDKVKINDLEIDVCNSCGAKFLDCDELEKLKNQKSN